MLHMDENPIQVLSWRTLGKLLNRFTMEDGIKVTNPAP